MEVQVWYKVPVACHVDTESRRVTRVVVIDEMIALDEDEGVTLADYSAQAPARVRALAVKIAESDDWPVWESGY